MLSSAPVILATLSDKLLTDGVAVLALIAACGLAFALPTALFAWLRQRDVWPWFWLGFIAGPVALILSLILPAPFPEGRCWNCGYNLTGNVTGRCPECGEPT